MCLCVQVECVEVPWGCGADEAKLEQILKADTDKKIKAVAVVHNETTTGVTSDIKQVREVRSPGPVTDNLWDVVGVPYLQQDRCYVTSEVAVPTAFPMRQCPEWEITCRLHEASSAPVIC